MSTRTAEVIVIGAGFAGLAAAQVLGRAQRDVVVLGSGPTRNAEAEHAHNILTRDGTPPAELLRLANAEVASLPTVTLEDAHVRRVVPESIGPLRVITAAAGEMRAEAVLLSTGARDVLPDVAGLAGLWGSRAHSCPFCDAAAYAGRRVLIVADGPKVMHLQALLSGWTDQLSVLPAAAIANVDRVADTVVVRVADGRELAVDGVFVGVTPNPRVDCVAELALARRGPYVAVDGEGRTSQPRLWAAGDCAWRHGDPGPGGQVVAAMASGSRAAVSIIFDRLGVHVPEPPPVEAPAVADPPPQPSSAVR